MNSKVKNLLMTLLTMIAVNSAHAADIAVKERLEIEQQIEKYLHGVIEKHVASGLYFVSVRVNLPEQAAPQQEPAAQSGELKTLPYTPLKVDLGFLSSLLKGGKVPDQFTSKVDSYAVTLAFDQSVPADTAKLLEERIVYQLDLNGSTRTLTSSKANLKAPVEEPKQTNDQAAELKLENARMESQRTKLELERQKFETQRQLERLRDEVKKAQEQHAERQNTSPEKPEDKKAAEVIPPERAPSDMLKDYQFLIIGSILAVAAVLGLVLISGSHKSGMSKLSDALGTLSEALGKSPDTSAASAGLDTPEATDVSQAQAATPDAAPALERDEKFEKFISLVEEKIEVLSNEGNFNFYRHFLDLTQENLRYAAAILVSVTDQSARKLLQSIPPEVIARLQDFLDAPGSHTEARSLRSKALQDFYGRIAMDEYLGSPTAQIKGTEWILKLSTADLTKFVCDLEEADRAGLLACLTPTRIAMMLDAAKDESSRAKMMNSLKTLDQTEDIDFKGLFTRLEAAFKQRDAALTDATKRLIDGPRFFAKIVNELKPGTREEFLKAMEGRKDIIDGMKNFFIPFTSLKTVAIQTVQDIFAKRNATQVAKTIFSADKELRDRIISVMPEMLRDTVKEELDTLDADERGKRKNTQLSLTLQDEVCRYLLKLNKEGLLEFEADGGAQPNLSVVGGSGNSAA